MSDISIYTPELGDIILLELSKNYPILPDLYDKPNVYIKDTELKEKYIEIKDSIEVPTRELNYILDQLFGAGYISFKTVPADGDPYYATFFQGFTKEGYERVDYLKMNKYQQFFSKVSNDTWVQFLGLYVTAVIPTVIATNLVTSMITSIWDFIKNLF